MLKSEPIILDRDKGTIVHVFNRRAKDDPERIALKEKKDGKWVDIRWKEFGEKVEDIAFGLKSLGVAKGDRVVIFSENRAEWTYADLAILAIGAVTVPLYANGSSEQLEYIVNHCEAKAIFINNIKQAEKVKEVRENMPSLKSVIMFSEEGNKDFYDYGLSEIYEAGKKEKESSGKALDDLLQDVTLEDVSTIQYTSGTTGLPKGCVLGHDNIMFVCQSIAHILPVKDDDLVFSFLPLAHVLERNGGQFISIYLGVPTAYAQSNETVKEDMREVKPTFSRAVPRFFEKTYNQVQAKVQQQSESKKKIFKWALRVGKKHVAYIQKGEPVPSSLEMKKKLANRLVYKKIKKQMGGRLRFIVSGGAPLSKNLAEFFASLDILIMEGYGLSECTVVASINREDDFHFGTVGTPIPGCEIKIADDGEIMIRHGGVFKGYYKDEEATKEVLDEEGWLKTGDIGFLDKNNCIVITDRKKDLIITAGGKNISPKYIENKLNKHPLISQAIIYGDEKPYLVALITIDNESLKEQAEHFNIKTDGSEKLSENEDLVREMNSFVEKINKKLSNPEQIRKVKILDKEFLQEKGEVTPSMQIKRNIIKENFGDLIEELYSE